MRPRRLGFLNKGPLSERLQSLLRARATDCIALQDDLDVNLASVCARVGVDEIVTPQAALCDPKIRSQLMSCLMRGIRVHGEADLYEKLARATPFEGVTADWLIGGRWDRFDYSADIGKRIVDIVLVLLLAVPALLLSSLIALAISLSCNGPIIYAQTRVGRHGVPFRMLKFRTMRVDAERNGPVWADKCDPRATALGRFLRRLRLDELPQMINVLRGDMSFVGPRPERPEFVGMLSEVLPYYDWRHIVRPGITGWAQVNLPYAANVEDAARKLEYDLYYVRHEGILLDLLVTVRTVTAMWRGP